MSWVEFFVYAGLAGLDVLLYQLHEAGRLPMRYLIGGVAVSFLIAGGLAILDRVKGGSMEPLWLMVTAALIGAIVGGIGISSFAERLAPETPGSWQPIEAPGAPQDVPTILVSYSQGVLPLKVQPQSVALVLQLSPDIKDQTFQVANPGTKDLWWPRGPIDPKKEPGIGPVYACELSNHGSKALLNLELMFTIRFVSAEPVQASAKRNKDGTTNLSVQMDSTRTDDPMSFAFVDAKHRVIAATSGRVVSEQVNRVAVPVIEAGKSVTVYFVSQTKYFTKFSLPTSGTVVVDGNPTVRTAAIIRPAMNPVDRLHKWGLQPSIYPWPNVRESTLNIDAFVAQQKS